jgi:hypothetical protein
LRSAPFGHERTESLEVAFGVTLPEIDSEIRDSTGVVTVVAKRPRSSRSTGSINHLGGAGLHLGV